MTTTATAGELTAPAASSVVGRRGALSRARAAVAARVEADVALVEAALSWGLAHRVTDVEDAASWGEASLGFGERPVPLAGRGAPLVGDLAPVELAQALGWSYESACGLMADALDLAFRLPRLWRLVKAGRVALWLARAAAQESRDLNVAAVAHADRLLEWQPGRLTPSRVRWLVDEARLYLDPDRAGEDERHAAQRRRVEVHHGAGAPGSSEVVMTLDTVDAVAFDDTVSRIAAELGELGDGDDLGARRARAVGVLADPQRALRFTTGTATPDDAQEPAAGVGGGRSAVLYLHLDAGDLRAGALTGTPAGSPGTPATPGSVASGRLGGVVRSERLGPLLATQLHAWLLGAKVSVRPVLDLRAGTHGHVGRVQTRGHTGRAETRAGAPGDREAVDVHDPPEWMAELVRLRDRCCVFPGCGRPARACDLDHIDPWIPPDEGGPPGQTRPGNLAPLCRRHHRAKTFGGWDYHRRDDGGYRWTSPLGRTIDVPPPRRRPRPPR